MTLVPGHYRKTRYIHRAGLASAIPPVGDVLIGTLYLATDTGVIYRSNGISWDSFSGSFGPSGGQIFLPSNDGIDGIDGISGPQGIQGIQGPTGLSGFNGEDGQDGLSGAIGPIADYLLSQNVALKNRTNAFTEANSFSTLIDLLVGQIKFPATANPSSDANTLDDYEEGNWTPIDASGGGLTFGTPTFLSFYIRISRLVYVNADISWPSNADSTHVATVGGLPFVNVFAQSALSVAYSNYATFLYCLLVQSGTSFNFWDIGGATLPSNQQMSLKTFRIAGCYMST